MCRFDEAGRTGGNGDLLVELNEGVKWSWGCMSK